MKFLKIFFYNIFFLLIFITLVEFVFGYWFDKENLGPYMREHRMKKNEYSLKQNNEIYNFTYLRNYYGFRGEEIIPKNIQAIIIGGSTTDERYKPENFTITENLNKKFKEKKLNIKIINAGIEGQSTEGHFNNSKIWFPRLKNFKPKLIIFYVGINDQFKEINNIDNQTLSDGLIENPEKFESIRDNLKSRSIFYDLLRKTKHKYYKNEKKRIIYDFDYSMKKYSKNKSYNFLNYDDAIKKYNINKLEIKYNERIKYYLGNIDKLYQESNKIGAKPIFINQLTSQGHLNEVLFILNYSLINHCLEKNYKCIDLAKKLIGKKEYWWDGIHTTMKGSEVIANLIFPDLYNFLAKN